MIIKIFIIDYFVLQTFQNCLCNIPKLCINTLWNSLLSIGKIIVLFARFCLHAEHKLHSKFDVVGKVFDTITACSYFLPELPSIPPPHKPIQIFHYDRTQQHRGKWWYKQRTWFHHLECMSGRHQCCNKKKEKCTCPLIVSMLQILSNITYCYYVIKTPFKRKSELVIAQSNY